MKPERFGHYTLLRLLGSGGMAEVFLARAEAADGFQKLLAIKRLLPPYNKDEQVVSMLADEARLSVWLNHPNIVQVLDFGRVGRTHYLAMEYVDGCDLFDLIHPPSRPAGRPLPLPTALYVMAQVADALDYAHRRRDSDGEHLGIIHRDVSPHNVLISMEGQIKLADFGLARASISAHLSTAGIIRGKFPYMPREQAHGLPFDHRLDIFAAGLSLYESLTGVKPYTSSTLAEQLYQLEQPIAPPSAIVADIPPQVDDITLRAISPDPEDRHACAADLADELKVVLGELSSFSQEANQLAALVASIQTSRPRSPDRMPHMDLRDMVLSDSSIIEEDLTAVLQAREQEGILDSVQGLMAPTAESRSLGPPTELAPMLDEVEDGDTCEIPPRADDGLVAEEDTSRDLPALPDAYGLPATEEMVTGPRMERGKDMGAGGDVALDPTLALPPARPSRTEEVEVQRGDAVAGEIHPASYEETETATDLEGMDEKRKVDVSPSIAALTYPGPAARPARAPAAPTGAPDRLPPTSTAGEAFEGEVFDEARTVQRSPEEALTAFQRYLDERERRKERHRREQRHRAARLVLLVGGGLVLFGLGLAAGWIVSRQPGGPTAAGGPARAVPPTPGETKLRKAQDSGAPAGRKPGGGPDAAGGKTVRQQGADAGPAAQTRSPDRTTTADVPRPATTHQPHPAPGLPPEGDDGPPPAAGPARSGGNVGYLSVMTDTPARVYVDDSDSAVPAPVQKMPLLPGVHRVRLYMEKEGTFSETQWVSIKAGETFTVYFSSSAEP